MTDTTLTVDVFQLTGGWVSRRWCVGYAYHSERGLGGCAPLIGYETRQEACATADRLLGRLWGEWPAAWPDRGVSYETDLTVDQLRDVIGRDELAAYHAHSAAEIAQDRARRRMSHQCRQAWDWQQVAS